MTSSPDPTDRTAFLDGFEQDLCPVVQERRGTQLAPTMIQSPESTLVEESGKVSQLVVDMSVDDSVDEESEGVNTRSTCPKTFGVGVDPGGVNKADSGGRGLSRKRNRKCWFPER